MKNKTIFAAIVIALLIVGAAIFLPSGGGSSLTQEAVASEIIVDRGSHDFGDIDIFSGKVKSDFMLTNTGEEDVIIVAATTSCGCTEGLIAGADFGMHTQLTQSITVPAGGTETLIAIYDPLAHGPNATGQVTRQLFLKTNSKITPEIEVRISANVTKNE